MWQVKYGIVASFARSRRIPFSRRLCVGCKFVSFVSSTRAIVLEVLCLTEVWKSVSSSGSFLFVGGSLVGPFTFCAGLSALGPLVFLTIWNSSLHILIYAFFFLQLVVSRFGEVGFEFIVSVRSLVCEISEGAFGPRSTSFIGTSCLTRLPKSLFTTAVRSSYEVAGRVVVLDRGIHFPAPIAAPCFASLTQGT